MAFSVVTLHCKQVHPPVSLKTRGAIALLCSQEVTTSIPARNNTETFICEMEE